MNDEVAISAVENQCLFSMLANAVSGRLPTAFSDIPYQKKNLRDPGTPELENYCQIHDTGRSLILPRRCHASYPGAHPCLWVIPDPPPESCNFDSSAPPAPEFISVIGLWRFTDSGVASGIGPSTPPSLCSCSPRLFTINRWEGFPVRKISQYTQHSRAAMVRSRLAFHHILIQP